MQRRQSNPSLLDSVAVRISVAQNTSGLRVKRTIIYAARGLAGWAQLGLSLGPGWLMQEPVVG